MKIRKVKFRSIYFEVLDFDWEEINNEDDYEYFILESNKIEGAIAIKETEFDSVYLRLIEIRKESIGKKYGEKLISFLANECIKRGMKSIHLDSKTELVSRYEKMGFVRVFGERMELSGKELIQLAIGGNNDGK